VLDDYAKQCYSTTINKAHS